jgi:L-amino acid N-acyltransferase YncA
MRLQIEPMQEADWPSVRVIYLDGIATRLATYETQAPDWQTWNANHRPDCRLVARSDDQVLGWAALTPVSGRCVYAGVAEVSVYVASSVWGRGIGKALLQALVEASEEAGIWTLQAGIFPENEASIALHKSCGFRVVGVRERLGQLDGVWRDVMFLERRSQRVGQ